MFSFEVVTSGFNNLYACKCKLLERCDMMQRLGIHESNGEQMKMDGRGAINELGMRIAEK